MSQLQALLNTVEELYHKHLELLELADRKKAVLIKGEIAELDAIVQEEMRYFQQLSSLEQRRLQELRLISLQEKIPETDLTITKLSRLAKSQSERDRMNELADAFPKLYDQLKEKNDTNARLLHQSLQFVQQTMQLLYPETENTYQPPQEANGYTKQRSLYDFKA